ncbi:CLAVATA3/ESR (CLE)-related protein 17 [Telopea speciosissima]|uniref:CLAVATA3/ESR (CLE)-related protein 17 n=1 Tax=Telopea speciosissima TaxID=54955 RepID=UPI001CC34BA8|nr:CLAVATA3/ESR (CLE)-related protein 17 [Telopea speciosissima]
MSYSTAEEGRRRRRCSEGKIAIFCLWVFLFLPQLSLLATVAAVGGGDNVNGKPVWSLPRRARFLDLASIPVASSPDTLEVNNGDVGALYGEDKRKIHTGPNPLHN